ncbi:MAG: hybrid sensor histidine kinase/response regulator [Roseiflexus sp.]
MQHHTRILIVEDDPTIASLVGIVLREAGYQTFHAETAADALRAVETNTFDLVVLDWMLPDTPGVEVCTILKERSGRRFLPVLMLTAKGELSDRITALDAGVDDYLAKPFYIEELMARVRALLRIRAAENERDAAMATLEAQNEALRVANEQLRTMQAQLVQNSKLAALGEIVAGVAHELNNPLAIILGNAELLSPQHDPEDQRSVTQIIESAKRARRVVQSLATFARRGPMAKEWTSPTDLIERVLDLKRAALRSAGIALEVACSSDLPMIWVDIPQMQQVLLNLLHNAEHALAAVPVPRVWLTVARGHAEKPPLPPVHVSDAGGAFVCFDVADNGPGMPDLIVERLFQPFVTTRPPGRGSGLGLAIAYGIVTAHGGQILINTQSERGTTVRVALPLEPPESALRLE